MGYISSLEELIRRASMRYGPDENETNKTK